MWRCTSRLDKKSECHARTVNEELLKTAFLEAIHILQENKSDYLEVLKKNIETVLKSGKNEDSESIDERLEKLQAELIEKTKKHEDYTQTAEEILELKAKKEQFTMDDSSKKDYIRRIKDLQNFIKKQPVGMQDFDEKLVNHLLAKVTVFENHIDFEFKSGIIVEVEI